MASKGPTSTVEETTTEGRSPPRGLSDSVAARRQRSKELAQKRRTTYKTIMDDLTQTLPFPKDVVSQLDYNSRLRLALCFFRLKSLLDSDGQRESQSEEAVKEKEMTVSDMKVAHKDAPGIFSEFLNEALDGFLMVALTDGTITYLSESIHKHLGLFQSEHIGISLYDLVLEEDHESVRSAIQKAEITALARIGQSASAELGFFCRMKCSRFKVTNTISKTPGYKLVYISGSLRIAGNETFLVVVVRPVSPPSILEIKMEGNMFVTHYTMQMKCTFFDGRLFQLLGYKKTDLLGDVVFTLHHHDDMEATMECSRGVMTRGEGLSGYFRFLTKYGYYVWIQTRASVMYDSRTGKPSYIVCMNFVIDREKGEAALRKRAITAKDADDPEITEIHVEQQGIKSQDRSHDPFPLVSREDGKVVNPLFEADSQYSPESMHTEVTSSNTNVSLPNSSPGSTVSNESTHEEHAVPDSTSCESNSSPLAGQMVRTNRGSSVRSTDTGYSSNSQHLSSGGPSVYSPGTTGVGEVSSMSHSPPNTNSSFPDRKSSSESSSSVFNSPPPSVFSSPPGSGMASHASSVGSTQSMVGSNSSSPVSMSQQVPGQREQNPQLSTLLSSTSNELPKGNSATPGNFGMPQVNSGGQQGVGTPVLDHPRLGKRPISQDCFIVKQEFSDFPISQLNTVQSNMGPMQTNSQTMQASYQPSNPPHQLSMDTHQGGFMPNDGGRPNQSFRALPPQSMPQGNQQFFSPQNTSSTPVVAQQGQVFQQHPQSMPQGNQQFFSHHNTTSTSVMAQQGHAYQQQSQLPDWPDLVPIKKEIDFGQPINQQFQQPLVNQQQSANQGYPFVPNKPQMAQFMQQDVTIDLTGSSLPSFVSPQQQQYSSNNGHLAQMQSSSYPTGLTSHPVHAPVGMGTQGFSGGVQNSYGREQLPVLTSEDLSVLDDLVGSNAHQYSQHSGYS